MSFIRYTREPVGELVVPDKPTHEYGKIYGPLVLVRRLTIALAAVRALREESARGASLLERLLCPSVRGKREVRARPEMPMLSLAYFVFGPLLLLVAIICADATAEAHMRRSSAEPPHPIWFVAFAGFSVTVVGFLVALASRT